MKSWFQNHRYKTKKAQKDREKLDQKPSTHQLQAQNSSSSPPKRVAVPVLVKDGKPCPSSSSNPAPAAATLASHDRSSSSTPESMSSDGDYGRVVNGTCSSHVSKPGPFVHRSAAGPAPTLPIPFPVSSSATSGLVKGGMQPGSSSGLSLGRFDGMASSSSVCVPHGDPARGPTFGATSMMQPSRHAPLSLHAAVETMGYADFAPRSCLFNGRTW